MLNHAPPLRPGNRRNTIISNAIEPTETAPVFAPAETVAAFVSSIVKACKSHAGADRNLIGSLLTSARSLERVVTPEDWDAFLAKLARKGISAKVSADSVKVYVAHAKCATVAATGRPPITEALPLGKHWADQITTGRKLEGVNAYYKRVNALLKLATRNEQGHLILPEGYSLMGVPTASPEADVPAADAPAEPDQGSAGQSADAEGGINVDPAKAKADALETAAVTLMGNPKAAALLLALIGDKEGRAALARLMGEHAKAKAEADAAAKADAKAGEVLTLANA